MHIFSLEFLGRFNLEVIVKGWIVGRCVAAFNNSTQFSFLLLFSWLIIEKVILMKDIKNILEYLEYHCSEIFPKDFYRLIFPKGELEQKGQYVNGKYNAIAISISSKKIQRYTVTDDLDIVDQLCQSNDFSIMAPISYIGKSRKSKNARFLYALAFDLDGLKPDIVDGVPIGIRTLFWQFDGYGPSGYLPKPTMIVMSGTGVHLYYVFEKPIRLFPNVIKQLENYKRRLTWQLWTQGVSDFPDQVQYESLFQGFRMPGTATKQGTRARAFVVDQGDKVTMEYMNQFVPEQYRTTNFSYKGSLTLAKAKEKYPEWYHKRIVTKTPRGSWKASRAVYDWWKGKIVDKAKDGHRYWCIMVLATYAKKCGISKQELEKDAFEMFDMLFYRGVRPDNPFMKEDIKAALRAYDDNYVTYPIDTIIHRTGIFIEKNKRNWRKREQHLQLARGIRELKVQMGESVFGGGRPNAEQQVKEWKEAHPNGKKADCIRETGLSKPTVYKWWSTEK